MQTKAEYRSSPAWQVWASFSFYFSLLFLPHVYQMCVCESFIRLFSNCAPWFFTYTQKLLVFITSMHCVERVLCFLNRAFPFGGHDGYHSVKMRYLHETYRLAVYSSRHELGGHLTDDAGRSLEKESNLLQSCCLTREATKEEKKESPVRPPEWV